MIGLAVLAFAGLHSCDECVECEQVAQAPSTTLVFINGQVLSVVDSAISTLDESIIVLEGEKDTLVQEIAILEDSIQTLNQLIADGRTDLDDELASVTAMLNDKEEEEMAVDDKLSLGNAAVDSLETRKQLVQSGAVLVSRILNLRNGLERTYEDSLTAWQIPLEVEIDQTAYELEIDGTDYDLTINYEREQTVDVERVVRIRALSLTATSSTYDSLLVQCPESNPNCGSGETIITCYF